MLRRFTSGLMTAVLFGTLLGGAAFARGRGECPMAGMSGAHSCCRRALSKRRALPPVAAVPPCCLVNLPQPAPANSNSEFKASADASTSPRPAVAIQAPSPRHDARAGGYRPPFHPSHSPPAYIQHSAFLI